MGTGYIPGRIRYDLMSWVIFIMVGVVFKNIIPNFSNVSDNVGKLLLKATVMC